MREEYLECDQLSLAGVERLREGTSRHVGSAFSAACEGVRRSSESQNNVKQLKIRGLKQTSVGSI